MDWVARFRASKTFGVGSCSTVDECLTDAELLEQLSEFDTFKAAWDFMVEVEGIHWERSQIPWKPEKENF